MGHSFQGITLPVLLDATIERIFSIFPLLSPIPRELIQHSDFLLKRTVAFALAMFLQTSGSRAGEPGASRDAEGMSLSRACATPAPAASLNAKARLGRVSLSPRACLDTRSGSCKD